MQLALIRVKMKRKCALFVLVLSFCFLMKCLLNAHVRILNQNSLKYERKINLTLINCQKIEFEFSVNHTCVTSDGFVITEFYHHGDLTQLPLLIVRNLRAENHKSINRSDVIQWSNDLPARNKDVVYILAVNVRVVEMAVKCLVKNFLEKFPYPLIIFHEGSVSKEEAVRLKTMIPKKCNLYLQKVNLRTPLEIEENKIDRNVEPTYIGYRHMIRFQSYSVYKTYIFKNVEYYLRLDTDSCLNKSDFDIFDHMRSKNKSFGYVLLAGDDPHYNQGMQLLTQKYIKNRMLKPTFYNSWPDANLVFFNNFEVSKKSLWTTAGISDYINYMDKSGVMYYKRLGDAPIKTSALGLYLPWNEIECLQKIGYSHKENMHVKYPNSPCRLLLDGRNFPLAEKLKKKRSVIVMDKVHEITATGDYLKLLSAKKPQKN